MLAIHERDLAIFVLSLDRFAKETERAFAKKMTDTVVAVHEGVLKRTPVDTGQAVANWQVTLDAPYSGVIGPVGPRVPFPPGSSSLPLGAEPNRAAATAIARDSRRSVAPSIKANPYRVVWVSNNAPHALALEYGTASGRAPQGMAGVTVAEVGAGIR